MKNKHHIRHVFALLMGGAISVFLFFTLAPAADAFNLYWVGASGASTSVASNWKVTDPSGCGGGDAMSAPNTSDNVIFDADCDNSAVIDGVFSVVSFTINSGYTGIITQGAAITLADLTGSYSQADGTFTGGSQTLEVGGNFSITGGVFTSTSGNLLIAGNYSRTSGTFNHNSGTVAFDAGTGLQTLTGETFYNLTINNTSPTPDDTNDVDPSAAITVQNNLTVTSGQFSPQTSTDIDGNVSIGTNGVLKPDSGSTITVGGNWTNSGTFTSNSGTVNFDGTSQALNDNNTFYNLTKSVTSADTLTLEASATQTVTNTTTLNGADCNILSLRSSSSGSQWSINPQGTRTVSYLDVKDSNNTNGTAVSCTTGCASSGNNTNWTLSGTTCSTTGDSGNTAPTATTPRSITQTGDNIEFKTDITDTDGDKSQLLVEYSTDQSNWKKATISKVAASQGDATITNSATYPIASIDTDSGKIKLTVTWNAKDNFASSEESTVYLRLTPYDGTDAGSTVISEAFPVDTRAPVISNIYLKARTSTSLTPAWTPESEKNFDKYVLCFGRSASEAKSCTTKKKGKALLAGQWTSANDSKLTTFSTSQTTITGLVRNTTYYIYLKATDKFGHTSTLLSQAVVTTDAPAPPFLTVAGITGAVIDLAWTGTTSATFTRYDICYGQVATRVTGSSCRSTGNPSGAVLKTFTPKTVTTAALTGLKENTRYYVKIWLRDSKYGIIAGNSTSAVTCRVGQRWVKGVCTTIVLPQLKLVGIEGALTDLSWTVYDSKTVTGYDMCYGQTKSRVTGTSCLSTGNPSEAKLVQVSATTLSRTLADLKEKTLYYAKVWVRDSIHGTKAGTNISFTTCGAGETLIKGKCTAPPPPEPTPTPTPEPMPELLVVPEVPPAPPTEPAPVIAAVLENVSEVISSAVESFTEFVEETFGARAAEVVRTVVATVKKIAETTVRVVKAVAEVVPTQPAVVVPIAVATAVAVASSTGLVSVVPNFTGELFYLGQRLVQGLVGLAGARKRFPWGRVVDAETGTPLPQTIVRILDRQTQKLRDTAVTDAKGDFASLLPPGQYRFEAIKPGWHLDPAPARFLNILSNQTVYDGNFVDVKKEGVVSIIVAMRTAARHEVTHIALRSILQRVERFFTALSWPLLGFGFVLSVLALVKAQSALNIGIFILYLVLIGAKMYVQRNRQETLGQVKDAVTQTPLREALVQLYNAETGRLMATKVTSVTGQFALVPPPGVYTVIVSKAGYQPYKESHVVIHPEKQAAVSMTFTLTPATPQGMSVEGLAA